MLGVMGAALLARPNRAWLLVGVLGGFSVYLFATVGLLLFLLLLAMAVTATMRRQAPGAWAAYLCGAGIMVLPIALAITVGSPLLGGLLVAGCAAALTLGVAGLALRGALRAGARWR
jgi:hypothetical protein